MAYNDIIVPEDFRDEVLFAIGAPFLTEEDFEELLPKNTKSIDVIQRFINRSIRAYNVVNPPKLKTDFSNGSNNFEIPYPENAYGVMSVSPITIKGGGTMGTGQVTNTFANLQTMTNGGMMAGGGGRTFGTNYNFGMDSTTFMLNKARMQGVRDSTKNITIENDPVERMLRGSTNIKSSLRIKWLLTINTWEQVPFSHHENIAKLASGHLLVWLGGLIERGNIGDLAVDLDGQAFINDGKDLVKEVKDLWATYPSVTKV